MAGSDRAAAWVDGEIVDRWPRPRRLGALLVASVALLVALELILTLLRAREGEDPTPPRSADDLRERLAAACADSDRARLLIGDSVLAGDVDLSFKSGIRIRPRRLASFGVFGGLLLSDLANSTIKNALDEEFWANDWGVRAFVGIELGLGLLGRSS